MGGKQERYAGDPWFWAVCRGEGADGFLVQGQSVLRLGQQSGHPGMMHLSVVGQTGTVDQFIFKRQL